MADAGDNDKVDTASGDSGIFSVGPPLHAVRGGYVRRAADDALFNAVVSGRHAHVLAPDRTGKSSLIAATAERLRNQGFRVARLDLAQITERDGGTDAGRWYYSFAYRLMRQLRLKIDLQEWWQDKAILSNRQRLVEFYVEVILQNIRESVVVFLDEVQCVENLPFSEHLLPSVRAAHNARTSEPEFQRLIFVLAGEGDPQSLFSDASLSPFGVSQAVTLDDFTRADLDLYATELNLPQDMAAQALDRIYYWASGQPYLTQKMGRAVARDTLRGDIETRVDAIAEQQLAGRAALHSEPHMSHIHRRVTGDRQDFEAMLNLYGRLRKGIGVTYKPESRAQRKLLAIGLVVVDGESLAVRNRLYEAVFTARWANVNLPLHWRGPAVVTAAIVLLMAIPFWYTQLLPKPYMRVLVSPTLPLETVHESWRSLRSFPGHVETADRLFRNLLENRAQRAAGLAGITDVSDYARQLPDAADLPARLLAGFWDRRARAAMRAEQRDHALVAALEALAVATPERRRVAAALLGDDYPRLIATLAPQAADRLLFNARDMLLTAANGARISQWLLVDEQLQAREPWTVSSLEVTPLVRRVVVDSAARVSRIGLSVNLGHARLDDLRLKLIAPSGRTVELVLDGTSASVNDTQRFGREQLAALRDEPVNGTWTLSLRDEATGVNGHLHGWNLSLNSQVVVETFDRGLDIPAPAERESDNIWFAPNGRYAVARALQSDNARMWDLANARPTRSIAVPASETVVGLTAGARALVTVAQDNVHLWNTATGRRDAVLAAALGGASVELTGDGQHLLITRSSGAETRFGLWSLDTGRRIAALDIAGVPAMTAIDASGRRLAIADYDRAVRVWDLESGTQLSQLALDALASDLRLSADGSAIAVVHGEQGVSLWHVDDPGEPVLVERGDDRWQLQFSPSGDLLLAGSNRLGFQLYRSSDGARVGPPLYAGFEPGRNAVLAFGVDEQTLLTAAAGGGARYWRVPPATAPTGPVAAGEGSRAHHLPGTSGDARAAIAPGGAQLALADREGHVHTLNARASAQEIAAAADEPSFLGHRGPVTDVVYGSDGSLLASVDGDGTIRVWDAATGVPRAYHAATGAGTVRALEFSPSNAWLAVLGGQRVWLIDVADGTIVADIDLGEAHAAMAFGRDDLLYLGAESGILKSLGPDRVGNWNVRSIWQGALPLRAIGAASERPFLVVVDAGNKAQLLDLAHGRLGVRTLQLPDGVREVRFTASNTRVLLRTARWIHRASVSSGGLIWLDALRAPKPLAGARLAFDAADGAAPANAVDPSGDHILLLTRDAGFAEVAELDFDYDRGPLLFGSREDLLANWRQRLALPADARAPIASP